LRLTDRCRPYLRGEEPLYLRRRTLPAPKEKERSREGRRGDLRPQDRGLFEALRLLRTRLAGEQKLPPYAIFHDATLLDLVRRRPSSLDGLRRIMGLGESKIARYGRQLLELIGSEPLPRLLDNQLSDTVNDTLLLYSQGLRPEEIARRRELKVGTIYNHLAEAIEDGLLEAREVLPLEAEEYDAIVATMEELHSCEEGRLAPLYEALGQAYDYGILKCVAAAECG
jgi:ATP-dependent DNA helicase RecQ